MQVQPEAPPPSPPYAPAPPLSPSPPPPPPPPYYSDVSVPSPPPPPPSSPPSPPWAPPPPSPPPWAGEWAGETFVINDFDFEVVGVNWLEGSYGGCHDSHGDHGGTWDDQLDFHHDGAQNKGGVSATYHLANMPFTGCLEVREWHPGGSSACSQYLPYEVPIFVHHQHGVAKVRCTRS